MPTKTYNIQENVPMTVSEPAMAYCKDVARNVSAEISSSAGWNPNVPFHGTQEEWWEHFHRIEEGNFMTLEEFDRKFETWKTNYLANKLK